MSLLNKSAVLLIGAGFLAAVMLSGCGAKPDSSAAANTVIAERLQRSFSNAEESTKQQVNQAADAVISGDYVRAITVMNQVARGQRTIDATQKEALDDLLVHTRRAIDKDPSIGSPQLFQATTSLQLLLHPID